MKQKLNVIQGLDKEILELSSEEDIVREIEEAELFCGHVELALARLGKALTAIAPKIEASAHMSKEPMNEPGQSVSHVNTLSTYDSLQSQLQDVRRE